MLVPTPSRKGSTLPLAADLGAHGDRVALVTAEGELTYHELAARVAAAAARLGGGRRLVVLVTANEVEPLVWYLAALRAGHPVLPVSRDRHDQLGAMVAAYDPDIVVGPDEGAWRVDERRSGSAHDLHPELALLLSTSGTTGSSKLVRLSYRNVQANAEAIASYLDIGPHDRAVTVLPPHYCYGLSVVHSHLLVGAGLVLTGASVVDPCFWERFRSGGATSLAGVPYTFDLLDRVGFDGMELPTLRTVTQAGGRLAPERVRRYAELGERRGWRFFVMYGQTEATARMAYLPPERARTHPGAVGVPVPGGELRIDPVDDVGPDAEGELVYTGPNVMLGYAEAPADLALGRTVHELRTGDLARWTDHGMVELVGRRSRFLKLFGLRVDLQQVDDLLAAAGVAAMCTGDDTELVVAVTGGTDPAAVRRSVTDGTGLPPGAVRVCVLEELPRLSNGKPDLVAVGRVAAAAREAEAALAAGPRPEAAGGDVGAAVRALYAEVLQRPDVTDDSTFVGLGGDSLSYVELSIRLEAILGRLPAGWHLTPLGRLTPAAGTRGRVARVETNVVLRAVAIVAVVATHAGLVELRGGAHVLLAVAGFNFARFQLGAVRAFGRVGDLVGSIARVAVPSMCWIALLVAVTDDYSVANIFLVNDHLGAHDFDERWRYWYVEALVQLLAVTALVLRVPAARRAERRWSFGLPFAVLLAGLVLRFEPFPALDVRVHTVQPVTVLWVFAAGWAAERATDVPQRLLVSAAVVVAVPGFFYDDVVREVLVAAGVLLVVWVPTVPVLRWMNRCTGPVAAASLMIYLTHWHVFPAVGERLGPWVAVGASVVAGIVAWRFVQRATAVVERALAGAASLGRPADGQRTTSHATAPS